ncbi:hypothetical protein WJX77_012539 [Trebouxia sp. C0004]
MQGQQDFPRGHQQGSQPGHDQKHGMEGKGHETADTATGDLMFVLQQKPHAKLRRSGAQRRKGISCLSRASVAFTIAASKWQSFTWRQLQMGAKATLTAMY